MISRRLEWHIAQIWPSTSDLKVAVGSTVPEGFTPIESYLVAPNIRRPRFLIPVVRRDIAASALRAYSRLRARSTRALKEAAALAILSRLDRVVFRDRLYVSVPDHTTQDQLHENLLLPHVARTVGHEHVYAAIGLNDVAPNRKPTVQVFDDAGEPLAFVKLGSTDLTKSLVCAEASALELLDRFQLASPSRPSLLGYEEWSSRAVLISTPMPDEIRLADQKPSLELEIAVAQAAGGASRWDNIFSTPYWKAVQDDLAQLERDQTICTDERQAVAGFAANIARRLRDADFKFGLSHGDWSAWNMGLVGDEMWVWDWEHMMPSAPVGLDSVYYEFQTAFLQRTLDVQSAIDTAEQAAAKRLLDLGVKPAMHRNLVDLHLLRLYLRAAKMHRLGAGWNERFHLPAVRTIQARSRS